MSPTERIYHLILIAFCGLWLLFKELVGPMILLLLLITFIGLRRKENRLKFSNQPILWIFLFVLFALSLTWSMTPDAAALERKLAFIAFPVLFSFQWKNPLPMAKMWLSHTLACLVLIGIAYYDALMCQFTLGTSVRCFSTTYFSQVHHPTYFSAFLIFSILGLLYKKIAWFSDKPRWISWALIVLFSCMHIHLGTLAGILALLLVFVVYISRILYHAWGGLRSLVAGISFFIFGILLSLQSPEIKADVANALGFTQHYLKDSNTFVRSRKEPLQGNELRLILWTASIEEAYAHPFGLGLGGMETALKEKLLIWGYPKQAKKAFNPHNQFLQVWNEIGIIGFILLCAIVVLFVRKAFAQKELATLLFILVFVIFCLFESVLQRESGIVFFLCWFSAIQSVWKSHSLSKLTI